ncbi:dienelactone hydrolase endo-1-3,1,4-beta-D-glucanase [Lanmaoa asiatica]|nr:dienelactone hydrolase endo-1-3,1,4-beta-D-glucanase [Lanmaoa asiatica]
MLMSCPDCVRGSIIDGTPFGTVEKVNGMDTYFVSGQESPDPEPTPSTFGAIFLTDAFGLELVNSKLIADNRQGACLQRLAYAQTGAQLLPDHPGSWPLWDKRSLPIRIVWNIRIFYRTRPSVVTPRAAENKYDKLGAGITVRLVPFKIIDSIVFCHPSSLTEASIKAIDVGNMAFSQAMRLKAEAVFAARKDKADFIFHYEPVDYKGTFHGFACRPNLAYEEVNAGFKGSLSQTVEWFRKTLAYWFGDAGIH